MNSIPITKSTFGSRLSDLRIKANYVTERELALVLCGHPKTEKGLVGDENTPVSRKTRNLNNWEAGNSIPNIQTVAVLCNILDCDPEYLLFEDATIPKKDIKTVEEASGLSHRAATALVKINKYGSTKSHSALNAILEEAHDAIESILSTEDIWKYLSQNEDSISGLNVLFAIGNYLSSITKSSELYINFKDQPGGTYISSGDYIQGVDANFQFPAASLIRQTQLEAVTDALKKLRVALDKGQSSQ